MENKYLSLVVWKFSWEFFCEYEEGSDVHPEKPICVSTRLRPERFSTTGFNGYSNNSKFSRNHELIRFQYCILISNFRFYICNHLSRHCLWNHFVGMLCLPNNISNIFNLQKQEGVVKSVHICSKEILHCTQKITTFGPYDSEDIDLKLRNAVLGGWPILHNPRWVPWTFG